MKEQFRILITDRNPHVREYLKHEMTSEGYRICLAKSGQGVLKWINHRDPIDMLILDPDLPDIDKLSVFRKLQGRFPMLPVVVHIFPSDYSHIAEILPMAVFVEKSGSSVEGLKQVVPFLKNDCSEDPGVKIE